MIDDSEREDFENTLNKKGLDKNDFELACEELMLDANGISPEQGIVTVSRKSNGRNKTYRSGHSSSWPADFHQDLENDFFK